MIDNDKFLKAYKQYCEKVTNCTDAELPQKFQRMNLWIEDHTPTDTTEEDTDFLARVWFATVNVTIDQVEERGINLFKLSKHWNSVAVNKATKIIDSLVTNEEENKAKARVDNTKEKILVHSYSKLLQEEHDPCLKLYLLGLYRGYYKSFFNECIDVVEKWYNDGYVPPMKNIREESFGELTSLNLEELKQVNEFRKNFDPKSKSETVEELTRLINLYNDGKVTHKVFKFLSDMDIKCRMTFYSMGGVYGLTSIQDSTSNNSEQKKLALQESCVTTSKTTQEELEIALN